MKRLLMSCLAICLLPIGTTAVADDVAAERARLANQRIQLEEERRARQEAEREARDEAEELVQAPVDAAVAETADSTVAVAASSEQEEDTGSESLPRSSADDATVAPAERIEMSRALEQLRELGALRDAGYLTEQEFDQLKKKILDGAL